MVKQGDWGKCRHPNHGVYEPCAHRCGNPRCNNIVPMNTMRWVNYYGIELMCQSCWQVRIKK